MKKISLALALLLGLQAGFSAPLEATQAKTTKKTRAKSKGKAPSKTTTTPKKATAAVDPIKKLEKEIEALKTEEKIAKDNSAKIAAEAEKKTAEVAKKLKNAEHELAVEKAKAEAAERVKAEAEKKAADAAEAAKKAEDAKDKKVAESNPVDQNQAQAQPAVAQNGQAQNQAQSQAAAPSQANVNTMVGQNGHGQAQAHPTAAPVGQNGHGQAPQNQAQAQAAAPSNANVTGSPVVDPEAAKKDEELNAKLAESQKNNMIKEVAMKRDRLPKELDAFNKQQEYNKKRFAELEAERNTEVANLAKAATDAEKAPIEQKIKNLTEQYTNVGNDIQKTEKEIEGKKLEIENNEKAAAAIQSGQLVQAIPQSPNAA